MLKVIVAYDDGRDSTPLLESHNQETVKETAGLIIREYQGAARQSTDKVLRTMMEEEIHQVVNVLKAAGVTL